ncbi:hypothetical protein TL16_g07627 [Triparma laevis f. inornata]|uniref:Uncharacterized protein n=1 Tax=Triparma laevis f. inornata TaxID=1714386 RepID=A0A9W7AUM3_9STRA|nr:hypothetical protein TL16_g07627 [Triparma laevis f. inornata]
MDDALSNVISAVNASTSSSQSPDSSSDLFNSIAAASAAFSIKGGGGKKSGAKSKMKKKGGMGLESKSVKLDGLEAESKTEWSSAVKIKKKPSSKLASKIESPMTATQTASTINECERAISLISQEVGLTSPSPTPSTSSAHTTASNLSKKKKLASSSSSKKIVVPGASKGPPKSPPKQRMPPPSTKSNSSSIPPTPPSTSKTSKSVTSTKTSPSLTPRTQPNLHPQAVDPCTGLAIAGSGGGLAYASRSKEKHLDNLKTLLVNDSIVTVKPDGKVIWDTAPFFNKSNITPRVNVFFGCGGGNDRDAYMQRMIHDRDLPGTDVCRDRAVPKEGVELEMGEEGGEVRVDYSRVSSGRERFQTAFEREELSGREGDEEEEEEEEPTSYAEIHRVNEAKTSTIEKIVANGGSYAINYMWRQQQVDKIRQQKDEGKKNNILEDRSSSDTLNGFYTGLKNHKIHRDRRVFGKFPGAGCVKPGEAWEEGLKERRRRGRKKGKKTLERQRTDSELSACVEVTKPKRRKHAPAIVRVTVKYSEPGSGKKKKSVVEIDTRAAMWELCEGVRRVTGVNVISLVSQRLQSTISSPYDIADGDVIYVTLDESGIGNSPIGGTFSTLGRQPMSYMRSVSPNSFGLPGHVHNSNKNYNSGEDNNDNNGETKKRKKKRKKKRRATQAAVEYDENGHKVVVRNVRKVQLQKKKAEKVLETATVVTGVQGEGTAEILGMAQPQTRSSTNANTSKKETKPKQKKVPDPQSPSRQHLKQILHNSPGARIKRSAERGAKLLVDFRNRGGGGGNGNGGSSTKKKKEPLAPPQVDDDVPVIRVNLF